MKNILTIDVEDYYMVSAFSKMVKFSEWDKQESRIEYSTERVLGILDKFHYTATFFILGWIAEKMPDLVKHIQSKGHEIASHGYSHQLIYDQTQDQFREDIKKSKQILEGVINKKIKGYRAPSYSITLKSKWAFEILIQEEFLYDSSIFPIFHDKGGIANAQRFPHLYNVKDKKILEIPLSTIRLLGVNVPFAGGGYFRILPNGFISSCIKRINSIKQPYVMYIHPWEFDPFQPRVKNLGKINQWRHYHGLEQVQEKFENLLSHFEFCSVCEFFNK